MITDKVCGGLLHVEASSRRIRGSKTKCFSRSRNNITRSVLIHFCQGMCTSKHSPIEKTLLQSYGAMLKNQNPYVDSLIQRFLNICGSRTPGTS